MQQKQQGKVRKQETLPLADHSYEWVDGSSVSFTKWDDNEPNNSGPSGINENYTELNAAGKWNDLNCSTFNRSFVCGKRLNP